MTNFAYIRISPADESDHVEIRELEKYQIDEWIEERAGVKSERILLWKLVESAREGDRVYVRDFTSLSKNYEGLLAVIEELENKNAHVISAKEGFDSSTNEGKVMCKMLRKLVEFHKNAGFERQREGIAKAKAAGKYKGRVKVNVPDFDDFYQRYISKKATKSALAKELGISRPTLDRLMKEYETAKKSI